MPVRRNAPRSPSRRNVVPQRKISVAQKMSSLKKKQPVAPVARAAPVAPAPPKHIQNVYYEEKDVFVPETPTPSPYQTLETAYPMTLSLEPMPMETATFQPTSIAPTI